MKKFNFEKAIFVLRMLCIALYFFMTGDIRAETLKEKSFVVVIASYNNKDWYKRNLDSVFSQSDAHFRVIYVDDASPDGTGALVQEYIQKHQLEHRVTLIRNEKRLGAMANKYKAIWLCSPHEIVVELDGDDWFARQDVLAELQSVYSDENVWLTHGQFVRYPYFTTGFGGEVPKNIIEQNSFRSHGGDTTALRSFYAGLFQQIKKEDLMYKGEFVSVASDIAFFLPMLEMAGHHIKFVPNVSYVYNLSTQINDHLIRHDEQVKMDQYIRSKPKYTPRLHYNQKGPTKKIYITPGQWGGLFDISNPHYNRDNCLDVLYNLRNFAKESGYLLLQADSVESLDDFEYLVVFDVNVYQLAQLKRYPKEKLILFLWEPPSVIPENFNPEYHQHFAKVFTWHDALVDNKKYFKFYYPVSKPMISNPIDFYFKRLSTLIACNKESSHPDELYSQRLKVINFFENFPNDDFDFYGKGWPRSYKTYQGAIERKVDNQKYYKFCYTYENIKNIPGYITEKIFDCFHAGAVPIYWGAPNIEENIPKNCFILRTDFASDKALYEFLKNMSAEQYNNYITNIKQFLASHAAYLYSPDNFIRIFMDLISKPPVSSQENSQ